MLVNIEIFVCLLTQANSEKKQAHMSSPSPHAIDLCKVQEMQLYTWKHKDELILKKLFHMSIESQ